MDPTYLNTVNRGGNPFRTENSTLQTAALIRALPNTMYDLFVRVRAYRVQSGDLNQVGSFWRRALFYTNGSKVVTQQGATQTPAADIATSAGWQVIVRPNPSDSTQIAIQVAADGTPTNWVIDVDPTSMVVDQISQA